MPPSHQAAVVVEHEFGFSRQTGVTLEPRAIVADFDPRTRQAYGSAFASGAAPDARRFSPRSSACRSAMCSVVTPDVGGAFGMKLVGLSGRDGRRGSLRLCWGGR